MVTSVKTRSVVDSEPKLSVKTGQYAVSITQVGTTTPEVPASVEAQLPKEPSSTHDTLTDVPENGVSSL
jgi:hypothetical protein